MGKKQIYILVVLYISVYAIIIKFVFPELELEKLSMVIAILGFVSALITSFLLHKIKGKHHE